jgi:hypothetical protein
MKPAMSLEDEKRLLLEQLENSRALYRRMLTNTEEEPVYREATPAIYDGYTPVNHYPRRFPQSQTMQWIMRNPYLFAAGAIALAVAGKKGLSKAAARSNSKQSVAKPKLQSEQDKDNNNETLKKGIAATTLGTSLATTAAMVLRNPAQMRAVMRAIGVAFNYYKSRRRDPRARFE